MLPFIALSISASLGCGFFARRAAADMICPDWQYPHCGTSISIHAFCTGWLSSADNPSIVVTCFPATLAIGVTHDRVARPPICTVHAPHNAMPQPNLVPGRPTTSRTAHSRGMLGSASSVVDLPLRTNDIDMNDSAGASPILQTTPFAVEHSTPLQQYFPVALCTRGRLPSQSRLGSARPHAFRRRRSV